ncbi:nonsense-mediated mRNA decay factor [Grosmannia clavigera kw1407]|uniref:Nonsense-mediated mRNA decay factor n=1 Tax=Grosmannia clavigera (strain kw1407 / UAMH 11150) TaxID=655863 RepID=F0X945_GROCL|nr:nonsense-mediated mRNA decay factor [Grosmannia clavigera kw1407]EFX05482.1 nonsense-mediated mRNA decay factor [Grosmannia clavigera kw1407]
MDRARKRHLRALNERAWAGETDLFAVNKSLDSSLKKNTAFIRRLRTAISSATLNSFLQEIASLSLSKYLSEIISACYEGLCRLKNPSDIEAGVEIVSALHQRFGPSDFTEYLGWLLGKGMAQPDKSMIKSQTTEAREKDEKERITLQRVLLRVVTELWLAGVLRTLDDVNRPDDATKGAAGKTADVKLRNGVANKAGAADPFPLAVLKDLLGHDREHVNLPLLVTFVKAFSWDVLGVKGAGSESRKIGDDDSSAKTNGQTDKENGKAETEAAAAADGADQAQQLSAVQGPPTDEQSITPRELQEKFKSILSRYFDDVKGHLVRDQKAISNQSRRNAEAYVKSGEVFEDRQSNFEKQVKAQERLVANAQVIADVIGAEMPELKDGEDGPSATGGSIGIVKAGDYLRDQGEGAGIWEDEEERRFYENLVDLKGKVPAILLEDVKKKKTDTDEQVGKKADPSEGPEPPKPADSAGTTVSTDELSTSIVNKSIGAQVDTLLLRLPDLTNKDVIDQTAIDFCFLNSKASRNRLVKALTEVPKGRSDLLPCWARLVATLGRYMPDIPRGLVEHLDAEFRSLQRRKEKDFLGQVRLSNIRYLAELTKFGIVPEHVVFHCLKISLDDFSRMNIEIISNLLENCGRYLLRSPETSPRMVSFLETLQRKKTMQHIGQTERMLIENAIYYVDPPERPAIQQKERTPMELFIRKLLYVDLSKRNANKILRQVVELLRKAFSRPWKVKYGNVHLLAGLLSALYRHHSAFVINIVDGIIESVIFGLEQNDFRQNQRRLAEVKYLGEFYTYRLLENPVIFDMMYKILTLGYGGPPIPGRLNPLDLPDEYFRIRLVATILETTGTYFNKGPAGKKLDYLLCFFQYYIFTKNPLPMDIEFIVQDTYALVRPQWKLATNFEEALKAFQLARAQDQKTTGVEKVIDQDDGAASDDESSEDENENGDDLGVAEAEGDEDASSADEDGEDDADQRESDHSESEDEEIVVTREEELVDPEEEAEFEREYARIMAESLESRKFDRKPMFDVALPVRAKARETNMTPVDSGDGGDAEQQTPSGTPTMSFSLLTKRGNRQQTRTLELPSDSDFAVAMRSQQQAEREEQQRIKNLVLNLDLRESEELDDPGHEKPTSYFHNRPDKAGKDRSQRVRKLQLSDVDWYGPPPSSVRRGLHGYDKRGP